MGSKPRSEVSQAYHDWAFRQPTAIDTEFTKSAFRAGVAAGKDHALGNMNETWAVINPDTLEIVGMANTEEFAKVIVQRKAAKDFYKVRKMLYTLAKE